MRWVTITDLNDPQIYGRIDDDGLMRVTCIAEYPPFAEWVAEGNTPLPWPPVS